MGDLSRKTREAALIREVRALDQGDVETVPDKLERIWDILDDYHGGSFHAAEEMLLRWLLKNMTGASPNAERVRRYPRAWDIVGAVFALIPLFSLAKSLADRRFVGILQRTLKEIAAPQKEGTQTNGADSDVEMAEAPSPESPANPRKRKRADTASFDLPAQRQAVGCLQTAEAVFEAIRILLFRCEVRSVDEPATHRMGAEHVKTLFSSSATDAMGILVPWIAVCVLALDRPNAELLREQSSWLSTFVALWELHLQSANDAFEVATHLSGLATRLLGRLTGFPRQMPLRVDTTVQERWARDLRRFLARNLILPARTAFLTKGSQEVVQTAVAMSSAYAQITFPVLFDLVSKSPLEFGGKASKKDYETWVQVSFEAILHATKNVNRENGLTAVRVIMEMAAERVTPLSVSSLRAVCKDYALRKNTYDWSLLLSIIKLNPDAFLISDDGKQLLERVLEKMREQGALDAEDSERAAQFIVLLAGGYAQARDLSSFVKVWLRNLAPSESKEGLQPLWAQKELANAVAGLVQSSLNTTQLVDLLEWLASQTAASESMARIHVLEAISSGISQEDFIDAANMKIFDGVSLEKYSKKEPPAIAACRWLVASKTIARGTLEEANRVWSQIRSDIRSILERSPLYQEDTFAAFKCCVSAWLANHPGAAHEDEAAALICSFMNRLQADHEPMDPDSPDRGDSIDTGTYVSWILSDAPRLLSLYMESDKSGQLPDAIQFPRSISSVTESVTDLDQDLEVSRLLLERESNVNNQKLMDRLIATIIPLIDAKLAVQFLLDTPIETLTRTQREAAMKSLVSKLSGGKKSRVIGVEHLNLALSLMVKLMSRPTFYEGMSFSHLESIGQCLLKIHKRSHRRSAEGLTTDHVSKDRRNFKLLQELAMLTIRQMAGGSFEERERAYLKGAISVLQSPCEESDVAPRIVLLHAFISTVRVSNAVKKLEEDGLDLSKLQGYLIQVALPVVTTKKRKGRKLLTLLVALEALGDLDHGAVKQALSGTVPSLLEASDSLLRSGVMAGWEVRMFLANHFSEVLASPLEVKMPVEVSETTDEDEEEAQRGEPAAMLDKTALVRYVDAVMRNADEDSKLGYLKELLLQDSDGHDAVRCKLVILRLIQHLKGCRPSDSPDHFGLAQAHSTLCHHLVQTAHPAVFLLTSKAIRLLLDQNPACITQWNIELTLSSVSTISARGSTQALISEAPSIYPALCRLVEIVIKRHRKRLDGHFHILIVALQSLLRLLVSRSHNPTGSSTSNEVTRHSSLWEKQAKLFARLLTLICEPTVASVSRSQTSGLDSEKDKAKRYAGQYMYLVLMQYVKLQLEYVVPHEVREALETGVYSITDITTQDGMKIMNDGMDPSGRVIFKEMYKQYQRFGKWTGV
ncbi:nucleolar pre-ribosomal-associated protein 2 [Achaetomium macrosporum]|uniref:Nucleolar pre-ribosomal-associated protein 2 n=1 Tax=Achaetomium macrosporum TaxID=79813 RepID=A0AAN7CFI1_9PEZI|nr:nucleolar pre-ribosomal-associated protein 2 [Achaetomium macrosporum]